MCVYTYIYFVCVCVCVCVGTGKMSGIARMVEKDDYSRGLPVLRYGVCVHSRMTKDERINLRRKTMMAILYRNESDDKSSMNDRKRSASGHLRVRTSGNESEMKWADMEMELEMAQLEWNRINLEWRYPLDIKII